MPPDAIMQRAIVPLKTQVLQKTPGFPGADLRRALSAEAGPAIVYVATKKEAEALAAELKASLPGVTAAAYHAGMSHSDRRQVHFDFLKDRVQVKRKGRGAKERQA